jgi:mono/diheme cytochrome c family protein
MWTRNRIPTLLSGIVVLAFATPVLLAQQVQIKREQAPKITAISGEESYKVYCAVCHGVTGRGDGPAAKALTPPPTDLTTIAKRHGGKFNPLDVKSAIIGDVDIPAHGTRDMPMWGPVFRSVEERGVTELRINNLVSYIEQLQTK